MLSRKERTGLIRGFLVFWMPALLCTSGAHADTFGEFGYTTNSTSATITSYTGAGGDVVIPDTLGGKPVTKISTKLFYYRKGLVSVTLPASMADIGRWNFASCFGLISINMDTNNPVYSSDGGILFNKTKTVLVQCPAELAGTYSVPAGVTNLGYSAFVGSRVTGVTLSASVSGIGIYAFITCTNLAAITADTNNSSYSSDGGVLFNKTKTVLVNYPTGRAGPYTIPSDVTGIGEYAVYDNREITRVNIPPSVTNIGTYAFWNCTDLVRADFLGNAPGMGSSVFSGCAAGFTVYYLAGKAGFTSPTWNDYPSAVLSGAAILPPGLPPGMESEYEAWVLTNAPSWNAVNFTAVPAEDFEKAWLVNAMPESNLAAEIDFQVEHFAVGSDQIQVMLELGLADQPKAGSINGWLAIDGRESMTNEWQTMAGQSADQNKLSFTNGQATVLFDKPDSMRFFRPKLQKDVPNDGAILPLNQLN